MKRGATKEEIIRTTQELIARSGIRAVRVDEIAQTLGISKRTLYELFADKTELMNACLVEMSRQQQERIITERKRRPGNPLQRALRLTNEYVDSLCRVDHSFLADIHRKVAFAEQYGEQREFWLRELSNCLTSCREENLLLPEIEAPVFADRILSTLFELRQSHVTREELYLFSRTILRGAATQYGIVQIDDKQAGDKQ